MIWISAEDSHNFSLVSFHILIYCWTPLSTLYGRREGSARKIFQTCRNLFQSVAIFFKLSQSFSSCRDLFQTVAFSEAVAIFFRLSRFQKLSRSFSDCRDLFQTVTFSGSCRNIFQTVAWRGWRKKKAGKNRGNRVSRGITYLILKSESAPATVLIILNLAVVLRERSVPNSKFLNLLSGRQGNHHFSVQMHVHHFYCKQITSI